MLEMVWRKGNSLILLVGMQTSTATMENSVKLELKKLEIELPYDPAIESASTALQEDSLLLEPSGKPIISSCCLLLGHMKVVDFVLFYFLFLH